MERSESITNLVKAMIKFQEEVKNPKKSKVNPHVGSKYADLADILDDARTLLSKHGLLLVQDAISDVDKGTVMVSTTLYHDSGEWMTAAPLELQMDNEKDTRKNSLQAAGSAITYGRRYVLSSLFAIAAEADDDGDAGRTYGSGKPGGNPPPNKGKTQAQINAEKKRAQELAAKKKKEQEQAAKKKAQDQKPDQADAEKGTTTKAAEADGSKKAEGPPPAAENGQKASGEAANKPQLDAIKKIAKAKAITDAELDDFIKQMTDGVGLDDLTKDLASKVITGMNKKEPF